MNIEKVKEIKKALECCSVRGGDCYKCPFINQGNDCDLYVSMDALTLINELESENERLSKSFENAINEIDKLKECYKIKAYDKLRAENKQLKDRIAELEKENQKYHEVATNCQKIVFMGGVCDTKLALKHFAERLKEKLKEKVNADNVDVFVECAKLSDKTLKEFIK